MKSSNDDSILSIYLEILVLSSFMSIKYTIKPIEEQIKHFINKQDDVFQHQDKIYSLLYRYNLLPAKFAPQEKFLAILNYLLENSELYAIIKSLKKLENMDTSILSNGSLKTVLDWTWYKFKETKVELTIQSRKLIEQVVVFDYRLKQSIMSHLKIIKNLIKIYELFIQLNKSSDGFVELNKKLSILQSFELYCEHLNLCLEYSLLPEMMSANSHTRVCKLFSFDLLQESWHEKRKAVLLNTTNRYTFGFIIDCLLNDCRPYANISKLLKFNSYPAKSVHEILEIFLECNLTVDIKQLIFLYFLIDIKYNISKEFTKKIDNLISEYCKNDTLKNNLLNLANGFYHLDDQNVEESYNHFRNCDINYLQLNEKYRILYNLAYLNKWNKALEFLWLFNNILDDFNVKDSNTEAVSEITEINSKLLISIYLSNKFINEAYEIVKNFSNDKKIYKQLIVYFLVQSESFNLWKPVMDFFTSNQSMLHILYSYLEAKQDLSSISTAIDLYLTNHNYTQAIQLYEKYARQINNSQYSYITSMIEAVKEIQPLNRLSKGGSSDTRLNANVLVINPNDIKEAKLNFSSKDICSKFSKRCKRILNEDTDAEHIKQLALFDVDVIRPVVATQLAAATVVPPVKALPPSILSNLTPQKTNISILKSASQSNASLVSQQLTPSKSVKFMLLGSDENEKPMKPAEVFEIVNLKEKAYELHKSSSVASIDSAMSTISSRSALNLPSRLADLENDEKLMDVENYDDQQEQEQQQRLSNGSSNSSDASIDSTISSKSGLNIDARLAEVATPSIIADDDNRTEDSVRSTEEELFKRPVEIVATESTVSFAKASSMVSIASDISTKSGLAERLEDFESHTIEENFRPLETGEVQKVRVEQDDVFRSISVQSNQSTISSRSAMNLHKRLKDFDNESACDEKFFISGRRSLEQQNTALQSVEIPPPVAEPKIRENLSSEIFTVNYSNVERSSNIDTSPMVSLTTVTPISTNLTGIESYSQATSIMTTDDRRLEDEIIFSISDNEENMNSSFTSISSKCTTNTEMSTAQDNDVTLTKGTKRRSVGRPPKAAAAASKLDILDIPSDTGPMTRSKLRAQSNRSSIDQLDQTTTSQQDVSYTQVAAKRATRNTRSMTRSPSPTNSVVSTASTTVARNSIKRRGSNRVKKPTIILSPTNIQDIDEAAAPDTAESTADTSIASNSSATRYNLRSRLRTPQKDSILETLVETAASLTPTVAKKGRKAAAGATATTTTKKTALYKIEEAGDQHQHNQPHPHPTVRHKLLTTNEFEFSNPHVVEGSKKKYATAAATDEHNNDNEDQDSSFTFSPPRQSDLKK